MQMHERIYTWVFHEVFAVGNFKFLLVWIVCSHIIQFSSADASSPTAWLYSALCHLHRLCASVRRLCIQTAGRLACTKSMLDTYTDKHLDS